MRYGTTTNYVTKVFTSSVLCSASKFGDPAPGQAKQCWYETYARTQMYALANPSMTTAAGESMILKLRFFGVPMGQPVKLSVHLVPLTGSDPDFATQVQEVWNHSSTLPANSWNGYVEYDYTVTVPSTTIANSSYRVSVAATMSASPYSGYNQYVDCNGIARLNVNTWATEVQHCAVATVTVNPFGVFYSAPGRTWAP